MARRRGGVEVRTDHEHDAVIAWYRAQLAKPASTPWDPRQPPVLIGPTWQTRRVGRTGRAWVLPERTLGWDVLGWCGCTLQHEPGKPWRFTLEQARWILWWYALEETGEFTHRDGILQRLKGWGKDPLAACLAANEALGPARFAGWENDEPIAVDVAAAWVQIAAVSLEQTKNTMRLFAPLFSAAAVKRFRIQIGKELIHALSDTRLIQAVTSSPETLEGNRGTFIIKNETQHWDDSNRGHDMAATIERNATKSPDGASRTLAITNAYDPAKDSSAQRDREAWEQAETGESLTTGIMYDSIEAPPEAPLVIPRVDDETDREYERRVVETITGVVVQIRGDSVWLNPSRIVQSILDTRNPPSRSRRFWYNQIWATEDAWMVPQRFELLVAKDRPLVERDEVALFFDGSKSDDATGIVACRIGDGHVVTMGMWQKPPGSRGDDWTAPRAVIDSRVEEIFEDYRPVAFFGDPSHTRDDETQERYWDELFDEWHRRYKDRLEVWAVPGKTNGHAVMWDMAAPARTELFTAAAERFVADVETSADLAEQGRLAERTLTWDGDGRLRIHVRNARRYPNRYGVSLWKGKRESPRKVDLAVCAVGARMVRRLVLNARQQQRRRSGQVW